MAVRFNQPTVQFCIEARLLGGDEVVDRFTIEQNEGRRNDVRRANSIYNTVQAHLSRLGQRNGLEYEIVRWGDPKDRTGWMNGLPFND